MRSDAQTMRGCDHGEGIQAQCCAARGLHTMTCCGRHLCLVFLVEKNPRGGSVTRGPPLAGSTGPAADAGRKLVAGVHM
jgi:hypothetical protein